MKIGVKGGMMKTIRKVEAQGCSDQCSKNDQRTSQKQAGRVDGVSERKGDQVKS